MTNRTGSAVIVALVAGTASSANAITGPSSSEPPYVVRAVPGVVTKAILTVGDAVGGYEMVDIPDGLGAFDNGDGTFTLLMNHELGATAGAERAHGAKGAFVSKWIIRKDDLSVLQGSDLIQQVATWNVGTASYNGAAKGLAIGRLCSADLPPASAFYDEESGLGYAGRIFLSGEEVGVNGRAFAHLLDGTSYELPALGKFSWENAVAHPASGEKTVVVGLDDTTPGQVYVYVGEKSSSSNPVAAAGLSDGTLLGVKVQGLALEAVATVLTRAPFTTYEFGNVEHGPARNCSPRATPTA